MEKTKTKYSDYFEAKTRVNGEGFICLKDDAPNELRQLMLDIHVDHFFGALPNDWIYSIIFEAFEVLQDLDLEKDEYPIESDIWNTDLFKWLCDYGNSFAAEYCNQFIADFVGNPEAHITTIISQGQYGAKFNIYHSVAEFLKE